MLSPASFLASVLPHADKQASVRPFGKRVCVLGSDMYSFGIASLIARSGAGVKIIQTNSIEEQVASIDNKVISSQKFESRMGSLAELIPFIEQPGVGITEADFVIFPNSGKGYSAYIPFVREFLKKGQNLVLIDAPLGASLEFCRKMRLAGLERKFNVVETGTLFDRVRYDGNDLFIDNLRSQVNVASCSRNDLRICMQLTSCLSVELIPSSNIIERGLCETEKIVRTVLLLFGSLGLDAENICDSLENGLNPVLIDLLRKLEAELAAIARVFKAVEPSFISALQGKLAKQRSKQKAFKLKIAKTEDAQFERVISAYCADVMSSIIHGSKEIEGDFASTQLLLKSDIADNLVLVSELALLARLKVPILDSIIELASAVTGTNLRKNGRHLADLGLTGFDVSEIVEHLNA